MNATRAILLARIVLTDCSVDARAEDVLSTINQPDRKQIELLRNEGAEFYNRADFPSALEAMTQALNSAQGDEHDESEFLRIKKPVGLVIVLC